jgi:hypothetical protein
MITDLRYEKIKVIGDLTDARDCLTKVKDRVELYKEALAESDHAEDVELLEWATKSVVVLQDMIYELALL